MEIILYIFAKVVQIFLSVVSFAMLARVLLQFFVDITTSRLYAFATMITEPFILPFRLLFAKLGIGQNTPLDIPFFVAYLSISFVSMLLPLI